MIFVDRNQVPVPEALGDVDSPAARERLKAANHFADPAKAGESFDFAAYKHDSVKKALRDLFHGKCAYCESFYAATQPMDVEHFRPKGGFIGDDGKLAKPGYWWLASEWTNLLPSCIDCNRRRQHLDEDSGEATKYGKENLFPVAGVRARAPAADLSAEVAQLLDPCRDRPREFFEYHDEGTLRRLAGLAEPERLRAEASLEVFGLIRHDLRKARQALQLTVLSQIEDVLDFFEDLTDDPSREKHRRRMARSLEELLRLRDETREYTALARQYIDPKLPPIRAFLSATFAGELAAGTDDDVLERFIAAFRPTSSPV